VTAKRGRAAVSVRHEKAGKSSAALGRRSVQPRVGPPLEERLDEALDLAIRARRVRTGAQVLDAQRGAAGAELMGAVAGAIVREDAPDAHSLAQVGGPDATKRCRRGEALLVRELEHMRTAAVVVHEDVQQLAAGPRAVVMTLPASCRLLPPETAPARILRDPRELFGVDVHEVPGLGPFVAAGGPTAPRQTQPRLSRAAQHGVHGGGRQSERVGDVVRAEALGVAELVDRDDTVDTGLTREAPRPVRAVEESRRSVAAEAPQPFVGGLAGDAGRVRRPRHLPAFLKDATTQKFPFVRIEPRSSIEHRQGPPLGDVLWLVTSTDGAPAAVNNLSGMRN
jgi:hypothetical protein